MKTPFPEPPPSRLIFDRYGMFGFLVMSAWLAIALFTFACLAALEGAAWLWHRIHDTTNEEEGNGQEEAEEG